MIVPRLARPVRRATAFARPLPDLLVAGGIRCGSTSLHEYLVASGCTGPVGMGQGNEIHFFDRQYNRPAAWYRSWYPIRSDRPVLDTTPSYLCAPGVPERARRLLPEARVVVTLRHPARRAASHFSWRRSRGGEVCSTLADAIQEEVDGRRLPAERADAMHCYLLHSSYEKGLQAWRDAFGPENVCVVLSERLFEGDAEELDRLHEFSGLPRRASFPVTNTGPVGASDERNLTGYPSDSLEATIDAVERMISRPTRWR